LLNVGQFFESIQGRTVVSSALSLYQTWYISNYLLVLKFFEYQKYKRKLSTHMFVEYLVNFDWKYNVLKIYIYILLYIYIYIYNFLLKILVFEFLFENFIFFENNLINIKVTKVLKYLIVVFKIILKVKTLAKKLSILAWKPLVLWGFWNNQDNSFFSFELFSKNWNKWFF
jgi:hypothetical protein